MIKTLLFKNKIYTYFKTLFHCQKQSLAIDPSLSFLSQPNFSSTVYICGFDLFTAPAKSPQPSASTFTTSIKLIHQHHQQAPCSETQQNLTPYAAQQYLALFTIFFCLKHSLFLDSPKHCILLIFLTFCSFSVFPYRFISPTSPQK